MTSSEMLRRVALVETDVSEERIASSSEWIESARKEHRYQELSLLSVLQLLVTANIVPSSLIIFY
jgi:hypothetical protein